MNEQVAADREEFVLNVQLMLSTESVDKIPDRLGIPMHTILAKLRRIGRKDLATLLSREVERYTSPCS